MKNILKFILIIFLFSLNSLNSNSAEQSEDLLNKGVKNIHYYIMSGAKGVTKVLKALNQ